MRGARFTSALGAYIVETLEQRVVLSVSLAPAPPFDLAALRAEVGELTVRPFHELSPQVVPGGSATPVGLTPAQVRGAYGLGPFGSSPITFNGIQGDGTGQTVAIVVAYHNPNALADLQTFSNQFGLPMPPSFTVVNQDGLPSPLPPVEDPNFSIWALEAMLDICAVHAMAPKASIVLVEADSDQFEDLILTAAPAAARVPGVTVVNMSLGLEDKDRDFLSTFDGIFTTPAGHAPVTFVAATGDAGGVTNYPAGSQNVVAVGGTTLNVSGNNYVSETGWEGSGGGIFEHEFRPFYQPTTISPTQRTNPDVSADADPFTGFGFVDSFNFGAATPWVSAGGTSLAAPLWGGMLAVANQGRVINGLTALDGAAQTLPLLYNLPASHFHDITAGDTLFPALPGYDLVTGRGSPVGNLLIPALANAAAPAPLPDLEAVIQQPDPVWSQPLVLATAAGALTDPAMITPGQTGFLNGSLINPGAGPAAGPFTIDIRKDGASIAAPASGGVAVGGVQQFTDFNIGALPEGVVEFKQVLDSTNAVAENTETDNAFTRVYVINNDVGQHYVLSLDPTGTQTRITRNGTQIYAQPRTAVNTISFYLSGVSQTLTIDMTNGNPLPPQGVIANRSAGGSATLTINGGAANERFKFTPTTMQLDGIDLAYAGWTLVTMNAGGGTDALTVESLTGNNTLSLGGTQFTLNGFSVNYAGFEDMKVLFGDGNDTLTQTAQPGAPLDFSGAGGNNTVNVNAGSLTLGFFPASRGTANLTANVFANASMLLAGGFFDSIAALNLTGGQATFAPGFFNYTTRGLTLSGGGKLDLSDNRLVFDYTGTSPVAAIRSHLVAGRNNGAWNGTTGIVSSTAAANPGTAVGFGEATDLYTSFPGEFGEDNTSLVLAYAYVADVNMDLTVNHLDFNTLNANFGQTPRRFAQGDGNYDNVVNAADRNMLFQQFGRTFVTPTGSISGSVFNDADNDGAFDANEAGLPGRSVFLDVDGDSVLDAGEPLRTTNPVGRYLFDLLGEGNYMVRQVVPANWQQTTPAGSPNATLTVGQVVAGANLGTRTTVTTPRIISAFVSGTIWSANFFNHLQASSQGSATLGFAVDPAAAPDELPWVNLNRVGLRFTRNVNVVQGNLSITGINVTNYAISSFTYDPTTFSATWTLTTSAIANDKIALNLSGVTDVATGTPLDAPARVRLNVLPGDANRSGGSVIGSDVTLVRNAQNSPPGGANSLYTIFKDVNGSGSILGSDVTAVRNRQGLSLPAGEPALRLLIMDTATPASKPPVVGPLRATELETLMRPMRRA